MDEAASRLRIEIDSLPTELDEVERRIVRLEIEDAALAKEEDAASASGARRSQRELGDLRETAGAPARAVGGREAAHRRRARASRS